MARLLTIACLLLVHSSLAMGDGEVTIPQDPQKQQQRFEDMLKWNRRTLVDAYDKVGKRSPKWDKAARQALETAARLFSHARDPIAKAEDMHGPAKAAVNAGCDDPLILYLYARSSTEANTPPLEIERRHVAAARALEASAYPPIRRIVALEKAAQHMLVRQDLTDAERKEAARLLNAVVALIPVSIAQDELNSDMQNHWYTAGLIAINGHRQMLGDLKAAYDHVDALLAKAPSAKVVRLQIKGIFYITYGWEARGKGFAGTVTKDGWEKLNERLKVAHQALDEAWKLQPNSPNVAARMITINMGLTGDRQDMEMWFDRAMKADGNDRIACNAKVEWLDPKWHGSSEELLAFGRACRATKNRRVGITLLLADCHRRVANRMPKEEKTRYLHSKEVWEDIQGVYTDYLSYNPHDDTERSFYAAYCYLCGKYAESDKQFHIVGENLGWDETKFSQKWIKQVRAYVDGAAKQDAKPKK